VCDVLANRRGLYWFIEGEVGKEFYCMFSSYVGNLESFYSVQHGLLIDSVLGSS